MLVKKFVCDHCGASKTEPYKNPYIVCDYCGFTIDVDYTAGIQVWAYSEEHTNEYVRQKNIFEYNCKKYLMQKNRKAYWTETFNYWDFYYKHYPEYLPPSIPKGEKYKLFVESAADIQTENVFNPPTKKEVAYNNANKKIAYFEKKGKHFVKYDTFLNLINAYIALTEQNFRIMYDNPKYKMLNGIFPEKFQLKMKLSQIAQIWLPYLDEEDAEDFLKRFNLKQEYVEVEEPQKQDLECEGCKSKLKPPVGALVCVCEYCRHENILRKTAHCHNCSFENKLPDNWTNVISCEACGTQLRVVQPLFGQ